MRLHSDPFPFVQSCNKPFENPAFFQREGKPFCEHCFSIMIRNEI